MNDIILLTGATGLVGRYVLRELLRSSRAKIAVLVRATSEKHAQQRIAAVLDWLKIDARLRQRVTTCVGDLARNDFGESQATQDCLQRCTTVVHAAANVSFSNDRDEELAKTNVLGTRQLLQQVGPQLRHWIQISTAYVAPTFDDIGVEQEAKQFDFRNDYEVTKAAAERMVMAVAATRGFALTIARPGIVVGEYDTGRASVFQGFYQPLRAVARLADRAKKNSVGKVRIPLRINVSPEGPRNLVPVDWVARVICELVRHGENARGIFHLTPEGSMQNGPTTSRDVFNAARSRWQIEGMTFLPELREKDMTTFERGFYRHLQQIAPYWSGEPRFDDRQRQALLPHLPCPRIDEAAIHRLLDYAVETKWGERSEKIAVTNKFAAADYFERFLPKYAPLSTLPRLSNVTAEVGFRVAGIHRGQWRCRLVRGDVVAVQRAACEGAAVVFEADGDTLEAIVEGKLSPQQAFFERRVEIAGDIEMGLKLAMIFGQFIVEFPYAAQLQRGQTHVAVA
ncbi:MAG: NAD-dependent epimerase/dehydratase family protein [Planctomycetes bacterium]|nr:NAD-dependent epimerase/dehydratase family protein [Planctomycetota bacterium]